MGAEGGDAGGYGGGGARRGGGRRVSITERRAFSRHVNESDAEARHVKHGGVLVLILVSLGPVFAFFVVWCLRFQGISYFRDHDYGPAGEKFEKVLRHARCIGEGKLEARALGNLATVSQVTPTRRDSPSNRPRPSLFLRQGVH